MVRHVLLIRLLVARAARVVTHQSAVERVAAALGLRLRCGCSVTTRLFLERIGLRFFSF